MNVIRIDDAKADRQVKQYRDALRSIGDIRPPWHPWPGGEPLQRPGDHRPDQREGAERELMSTQLELRPEGSDVPHHVLDPRPPRQVGASLPTPGEELTFPADRETTDLWAENFRRRGIECEVVPNGRRRVVRG